jgi:hypothetical protein
MWWRSTKSCADSTNAPPTACNSVTPRLPALPDADDAVPLDRIIDEVLAADRVHDDVDAARVGQLVGALDEAIGRVVDAVVEPEVFSRSSFSSLEAVEITVAPACLAS